MNTFRTTIETTINSELEEIRIRVLGECHEQVMSLKDKATREALISMGWTPPLLGAVDEITTPPYTTMETGPGYTECEEGWGFMCDSQS